MAGNSHSSSCTCKSNEWKVQIAQFVPPPSLHNTNANRSLFKTSAKTRFPSKGVWISSNSPALLTISTNHCAATIRLLLNGNVHEEHLVSKLRFTWPQISCQANLGTTGSRVIFCSYYKKCLYEGRERSKFALLFDTAMHAQLFISKTKDILQANEVILGKEAPRSTVTYEESSTSEFIVTYKPQSRESIDAVPSEQAEDRTQEMHSSMGIDHSWGFQEEQEIANQPSCVELPPSFTSLLKDCHIPAEVDEGNIQSPEEVHGNPNALKDQIIACFLDPTFQDFLCKVEKVWHELGEDLGKDIEILKLMSKQVNQNSHMNL